MRVPVPVILGAAALALCAGCALVPEHSDSPRARVRGPIPERVQQPIKLGQLAFRPRGADTQPAGTTRVAIESAYSNIFQDGTGADGEKVLLDGELWNNTVIVRSGISECADVQLEVSVLYATGGFLDRAIENWHAFLGLPDGGRDQRPTFAYDMQVEKGGATLYHLEGNEPALLDIPLTFTQRLVDEDEDTPALAVRAAVDLPTGSEKDGFGNGGWDCGAGLLAQKSEGRWTWTGGLDWTHQQRPSSFVGSGVQVCDGVDLQLGAEYRWNDRISLLAGAVLTPPVTRDFGIRELNRETLGLDLGVAWDLADGSQLHVGLEEDLISASGPDFTLFAGWTLQL